MPSIPATASSAENADFARACEANGIIFIGPPSNGLEQMGDKLKAKEIAISCGVTIIPGSTEPLKDGEEALAKAIEFGFPIILKAAAGGGGRGIVAATSLKKSWQPMTWFAAKP